MASINKISFSFLISCLLISVAIGQTSISGDLSKFKLESSNNPFIVEADIDVPAEKSVIIGAGCIFLFKMYTGFTIKGALSVEGTSKQPVIFTSINDTAFNKKATQDPDPFDWNGIIIDQTALSVVLKNFKLSYSVNGLKSQKKDVIIQSGIFSSNGQFNFTIYEKIIDVQDNHPFTFPLSANVTQVETNKDGQTSLQIGTDPTAVEVYIDKKPGKRVSPNARTPITISHLTNPSISVTLFKKGYADTTISLNLISGKGNQIDIALSKIQPDAVTAQNRLLSERSHFKMGKVCLITSPFFIAGGAALVYLSERDRKQANKTSAYVNNSFTSTTEYEELIKRHKKEVQNWKMKSYPGFALLGLGIIECTLGFILYF